PTSSRATAAALVAGLGLSLTAGSCFFWAEGREPPVDRLYFPTGVLASPGGSTLYVANSDFDLRYSGGTLMALNLPEMRARVRGIVDGLGAGQSTAEICGAAGPNTDEWLNPGPCGPIGLEPFIERVVFIGAFASGLLLTHEPNGDRARLFAPVRGDPSITYFDVTDDRDVTPNAGNLDFTLECGQAETYTSGTEGSSALFCSGDYRLGQDPDRNLRGLQLPADPVGLAANPSGEAIVIAHQTQGTASLVVNDWATRPELAYFVPNLAAGPTEVAAVPEPAFVALAREQALAEGRPFIYRSGYAITFRGTPELDLLRYIPDSGSVPPRPFIQRELAVGVFTTASGFDSRGVAIIDTERRACEESCGGVADALACLTACAENIPLKIYMANRSPASLLVGDMRMIVNRAVDDAGVEQITSATEDAFFFDSVPLDFGASRVEVGQIVDKSGELVERIFAVAFDTRRVFVFDPFTHQMEAVIRTGRGPHDIGFDVGVDDNGDPYAYLYVGHFTDSYLGVVDLDQRRPATFGSMVATIGDPEPPEDGT
ncbi:MAG: hypothetical protein RIF41_10505, partial [Polyangiaceae bacterium]